MGTTWMDLEGIRLSEISQIETDKCHMISLISRILKKKERKKNHNNNSKARLKDKKNILVIVIDGRVGIQKVKTSSCKRNTS